MHIKNMSNAYAEVLGALFDKCPKSVFAAIAVSLATCGGDHLPNAQAEILREWTALYDAGIVPQKPPENLWVEIKETWMEFEQLVPEAEARAQFESKYGYKPEQVLTDGKRQFAGPVGMGAK